MPEKLKMAEVLVALGVDILEAGFPIASDGDFEAVDAISRQFPWVQVAARRGPARWTSSAPRKRSSKQAAANSYLYCDQRYSFEAQAAEDPAAGIG